MKCSAPSTPRLLTKDEEGLLQDYRALDDEVKRMAIHRIGRFRLLQDGKNLFQNKAPTEPPNSRRPGFPSSSNDPFERRKVQRSRFSVKERELVTSVIEVCTSRGETKLDVAGFLMLHKALCEILGHRGQMTWEGVAQYVSADAMRDFKHIDLDGSGDLVDSEIGVWLQDLCDHIPKYYRQFTAFVTKIKIRLEAKIEVDKFHKTLEVWRTMSQYDAAYQRIKEVEVGFSGIPSESFVSPVYQEGSFKNLQELLAEGKKIMPCIECLAQEVCTKVGIPFWSMGPLKQEERAKEKIETDYKGDVRRLLDVVRISLVMEKSETMTKAIQFFKDAEGYEVVRVKSSFEESATYAAASGGYRIRRMRTAFDVITDKGMSS